MILHNVFQYIFIDDFHISQSYDTRGYSGYSQDYRQSYNGSTEAGSYGQVAQDSSYSYEARPSGYGAYGKLKSLYKLIY